MLGWNVGGVYLVACAFQAVILVCAAYTLFFLKSVLISFSPKFSVHRSLLLRINQCSSSLIFQFIQLSSHKLQETGVEKPRVKCCDHLILSVQTLLNFSSIKHQTTCFVYIAILFSRDSGETFRGKRNWRKGKGEQNVEREKETVERGETRPIWPRKVRKMKGAVWYAWNKTKS